MVTNDEKILIILRLNETFDTYRVKTIYFEIAALMIIYATLLEVFYRAPVSRSL